MSAPSARRRGLRRLRGGARAIAGLAFLLAAGTVAAVFLADGSPLTAAGALYGATVAWGVGEMAHLRERHLFRPGRPPPADSSVVWWTVRLILVAAVSTLPAALLLGGLTRR